MALTAGKRTPDVIFIGPYKAGTTFLRAYFSQHPQISWTRHAQFFLNDENFTNNRPYPGVIGADACTKCYIDMFEGVGIGYIFRNVQDWAAIGFTPGTPIDGKVLKPDPTEVARRIKLAVPNARILLILRNQIDWLRSSFLHHITFLPRKHRTFGDFLNSLEGKSAAFAGLFHQTITAYHDQFGRDNVYVMLLEALEADTESALRGLCTFLNVDYVKYESKASDRNQGKSLFVGRAIAMLSKLGFSDGQIRFLGRAIRPVAPALGPIFARDVISKKERLLMRALYAASNYHTCCLTGLDLRRFDYPL